MSANLLNLYTTQFSSNVALLLQRDMSCVAPYFTQGAYVGEQASPVDQVGAVEATEVTNRFQPMHRVDAPVDRPWVFPRDFDLPQMIDTFDKLRLMSDPMSAYNQNAANAMRRAMDNVAYGAFFSDRKTGKLAGTTTPWATTLTTANGQNVSASFGAAAATKLSVAKLREAKRKLLKDENNPETARFHILVDSDNNDALLGEVQVISKDFNQQDRPVLESGLIKRFLGFDFHMYNGVTQATDDLAGQSTQIPAWVETGMHFGTWNAMEIDISQRKDIRGLPWQAYAKETIGATRLEEKKIIRIWCR